jgi:hypothetical protein
MDGRRDHAAIGRQQNNDNQTEEPCSGEIQVAETPDLRDYAENETAKSAISDGSQYLYALTLRHE